jgi:hypothetical protein
MSFKPPHWKMRHRGARDMANVNDRARQCKQTKQPLLYLTISRYLCEYPPIWHRHTRDPDALIAFEFAIAMGVIAAARAEWSSGMQDRAYAAGAKAIEREKALSLAFKKEWRDVNAQRRRGNNPAIPKRQHTFDAEFAYTSHNLLFADGEERTLWRPIPTPEALRRAGSDANKRRLRRLRQKPAPAQITVDITRRQLLCMSGVATGGHSHRRLDAALKRLTHIGDVPIVAAVETLPDGRLRLTVSGQWLNLPFVKVPWPLPIRSPTALALYLFLQAVRTDIMNKKSIASENLYERLGIATRGQHPAARARTLKHALKIVNDHLNLYFDADRRDALELRHRVKVPGGYEMHSEDDEVRFEALSVEIVAERRRRQRQQRALRRRDKKVERYRRQTVPTPHRFAAGYYLSDAKREARAQAQPDDAASPRFVWWHTADEDG